MSKSPDNVAELIKVMREENRLLREEAIARDTRLFLRTATVKTYNGSKNPVKIQYFLDEIVRISSGFTLTDEQKIIVAGRNMTGVAEKWYLAYQDKRLHQRDTFEEFGKRLRENFSRGYDRQEQYHRFNSLRQTGRVEDFNLQFRKTISEFSNDYFPPEMRLHQYLEKLKFHIKREVKCRNPKDLEEAMRVALIFE